MSNYLGIDWGSSKVGLAVADDETKIAFAHSILKNDQNIFDNLKKIIDQENVSVVVIGFPLHDKHKKSFDEKKIGDKVKKMSDVLVEYQSEIFTTKMAQKNLIQRDIKGVGKVDDKESARIILQEWLDHN